MSGEKSKSSLEETYAALTTLFSDEGPLSEVQPGFLHRPEQLSFACASARSLREGVLLADVPTGTGKGLAYLAASILSGERAVVSTATIALQTQLLTQDLPVLRRALALMGGYPEEEGFTFAVMKGRPNFLCGSRHEDTLRQGTMLGGDLVRGLDEWISTTQTGDREDVPFPVPIATWREVASDGEDCVPGSCRFREGCFYYAHRERAIEADVIVVNHSLLLANAAAYGNIFPTKGRQLIVDEAHRLEEIMSEAFGARVSYWRVRYAMRQARKRSSAAVDAAVDAADRAEAASDLFFDDLRGSMELGSEDHAPRSYKVLLDSLYSVREALANDPKEEANNLAHMVGRLRVDLKSFYCRPEETHAYAVMPGIAKGKTKGKTKGKGGRGSSYPELRSWLIETGEAFREDVLGIFEGRGAVLCSATLAEGSGPERSFSYTRRRLGLEEELGGTVREHAGEEIFDYEGRALLYLAGDLPDLSGSSSALHTAACARRAEELVALSRGRALILLSTARAVAAFKDSFDPPYPVRYQGDDSPGRLVAWLKETEGAILVGTRTFWEGVSVSEDALNLVVIDWVPFAPPDDPVASALKEKAGKDCFRALALPKARVAMRQGAGRLMRTTTDRGVIAVLDPRLNTKSWGKAVLSSLPPAPLTYSLTAVERFFEAQKTEKV